MLIFEVDEWIGCSAWISKVGEEPNEGSDGNSCKVPSGVPKSLSSASGRGTSVGSGVSSLKSLPFTLEMFGSG
jgi:hypothetical protein